MKNTRLDKLEALTQPAYDFPLMVSYKGHNQYKLDAYYPEGDIVTGDELQAIIDGRNTAPYGPKCIIIDDREMEKVEYSAEFPAYADPEYPRYIDKDDEPREFD